MSEKKKTGVNNPPSVTGEPSGVSFNIPNSTFNIPVTLTTPPVKTVTAVTVTGTGKPNKAGLDQIEKLKKFLATRLHGPWTPEFLAEANKMLDELKPYVQ